MFESRAAGSESAQHTNPFVGQIVVSDPMAEVGDGVFAVSVLMRGGPAGDGVRMYLRLHGAGTLDTSATPFVPVAAVVAAWAGVDLVIDAPVDATAVAGARHAIAMLANFGRDDGARAPRIIASEVIEGYPGPRDLVTVPAGSGAATNIGDSADNGRGVGLFFTRGVDSTATLLTDAAEITHLIGIDWADPPYHTPGTEAVFASTTAAAAERGLPLVRVTTNVRDLLNGGAGWRWGFGPALASFGLALAPMLGEVRISSAFGPGDPAPNSSQEMLDPLWSSSSVAVVHRALGARLHRTAIVAADPWAMRWLKVCWVRAGDGNCGECPKCLMTMTGLYLCGAGDMLAACFDAPLTVQAVVDGTVEPRVPAIPIMVELVDSLSPDDPLHAAWERALLIAVEAQERESATGAAPDTVGRR